MFGYVRPRREELRVWELDAYQAVYCGLCHTLGRRYGFLARFTLNYDFAFLAMLLTPQADRPEAPRRRCAACPLRGKPACQASPGLDAAADESVILTYWRLRDQVADRSVWRGLPARLLSMLLRPAYRKAAGLRQSFDGETRACLNELRALETANCPSLDRPADTFARILQAAAPTTGQPAKDRAVAQMLYHVGRWIYLVDAWDDLDEDREAGSYNPILARWPGGVETHREDLRLTLRHSLNLAVSARGLLEPGCWSGVLDNILYLGLPTVEEAVFTGQWRATRKQINGRARHERSLQRTGRQPQCQRRGGQAGLSGAGPEVPPRQLPE